MVKTVMRRADEVSHKGDPYGLHFDLPSRSATMSKGYPSAVACNPFTVAHIKKLVYAPDDEHYYEVCADVIDDVCDVNVRDLALLDFDCLMLFLRIQSCGGVSQYSIICPECKMTSPVEIDLTKLDIRDVPADYEEPKKVDEGISLVAPRLQTRIELGQLDDPTEIDFHTQFIMQGETLAEKTKILEAASPMVLSAISDFSAKLDNVGVDPSFTFKCKGSPKTPCQYEEKMIVPFRGDFFLPNNAQGGTI